MVGGMTGLAQGIAEDPSVGMQQPGPAAKTFGMTQGRLDSERNADDRRTDLGDQILETMGVRSEGERQIATKARRVPDRVKQLMNPVPEKADRIAAAPVRQRDHVVDTAVECPRRAEAESDAGRGKQVEESIVRVAWRGRGDRGTHGAGSDQPRGTEPWSLAARQLGKRALIDVIEGMVRNGFGPAGQGMGHRDSPRRVRRGPLPPRSTRHGRTGQTLTLGALPVIPQMGSDETQGSPAGEDPPLPQN